MVYGETRYGEFRWGEGEESPEPEDSRAAQLAEQRGREEADRPTPREAFGAGLKLAGAPSETDDGQVAWDLVVNEQGSLATTSGVEMLGQDLAFAISRETDPVIGQPTPETFADLANQYSNVVTRDPRVYRVPEPPEVYRSGVDTIGAEMQILAADDEYHDVVIPVQPTG
ncbi:hypothetical protein [Halococcus saccharolyticus]|uniref:Uncharacterized protein n=1 Tax=Halococcus saccharolyticus DSM 5350 TaxID=1227455 RepID=M0MQT9_9EURY|nr:hypothetical protein [Halococcus saccharolyticus]EMA47986.1 hypothetical protein C449_00900 [Halococcus saccharolyticus DSM 5350]